jgi:hypothetical protein
MSGQFQLRTAGGAYLPSTSTYQVRAVIASGELTTMSLPFIQLPPKPRNSDG